MKQQELNEYLLRAAENGSLEEVKELKLELVKELIGRGAELNLFVLSKYPKEVLEVKRKTSADVWSDILFFIIREQDKYSAEEFKKYVLEFLDNTKTEVPDNIRIILSTLI